MLARVAEQSTKERTHHALLRALASGEPSAAAIAQELGMSERTLRRRLEDEATSFREVVEMVRRHRAEQLLQEGRATITEIAFLLGFSDPSAFSRAFRRWHQVGPREYREARVG
jgi:AraC-like DNA-binding protein